MCWVAANAKFEEGGGLLWAFLGAGQGPVTWERANLPWPKINQGSTLKEGKGPSWLAPAAQVP